MKMDNLSISKLEFCWKLWKKISSDYLVMVLYFFSFDNLVIYLDKTHFNKKSNFILFLTKQPDLYQ